jgi:hypothetical protein
MLSDSSPTRKKRGILQSALDFLFGTSLDSDVLNAVKQNLKTTNQNMQTIVLQFKNQVHMMNITRGELRENRRAINQVNLQMTSLNRTVEALIKSTSQAGTVLETLQQISYYHLQMTAVTNLMSRMKNKLRSWETGMHVLTNGRITTSILSPATLFQLLSQISENPNFPANLRLPFNPSTQIKNYYPLLTAHLVIHGRNLILLINIPLIAIDQKFLIQRAITVPVIHNTSRLYYEIVLTNEYIGISPDQQTYFLPPKTLIQSCLNRDSHICPFEIPRYSRTLNRHCLADLFFQNDNPVKNCKLEITHLDRLFPRFISPGQWLIPMTKTSPSTLLCPAYSRIIYLKSPFSFQIIPPACSLTNHQFSLTTPSQISLNVSISPDTMALSQSLEKLSSLSENNFSTSALLQLDNLPPLALKDLQNKLPELQPMTPSNLSFTLQKLKDYPETSPLKWWQSLVIACTSLIVVAGLIIFATRVISCPTIRSPITNHQALGPTPLELRTNLLHNERATSVLTTRTSRPPATIPATPQNVRSMLENMGMDFTSLDQRRQQRRELSP